MTATKSGELADAEATDGDLLYHYTTLDGLQGILATNTIRATDISYLNDSAELRYGALGVARVLDRLAGELPGLPEESLESTRSALLEDFNVHVPTGHVVGIVAQQILALVDEDARARAAIDSMPMAWNWGNAYVACFTDSSDSLLHWRGYAAGDGFAIGFDRSQLVGQTLPYWNHDHGQVIDHSKADLWHDGMPVLGPMPVRYGDDALGWIREFSDDLVADEIPKEVPFMAAVMQYLDGALSLCATVKHGAYAPESEWRLVACKTGASLRLKFRRGLIETGGVVPYVEIPFEKRAVKSILVGPGQAMDLRVRAVRQMVETLGYGYADEAPEVVPSTVPFRSS